MTQRSASSESNMLMNTLNWAYDKALIPAESLAADYRRSGKSLDAMIEDLISMQMLKSGTAGLVTGLGGLITLPIAIPANLTALYYIQITMVGAIAHLCGHDLRSDQVRIMVFASLTGSSVTEVLRQAGIRVGERVALNAIRKHVTQEVVRSINRTVGMRLLTKAGEKGVINLTKLLPLVGGVIGGGIDAASTSAVGKAAKKVFKE